MMLSKAELRRLYHKEGLTQEEIGNREGVTKTTISQWMKEQGVDARSNSQAQIKASGPPSLCHDDNGYEVFNSDKTSILHHRLLGVAMFGYDAVVGNHIHHSNELEWDTRPANINLFTPEEHASHHHKQTDFTDDLLMMELYHNGSKTQSDLGDLFGINQSEVSRRVSA